MLIKGKDLNEKQIQQVKNAFIYRWTLDNHRLYEVYMNMSSKPTCPKISDQQWINEHAFHFLKDGSRLMANRHYAEPHYMADN